MGPGLALKGAFGHAATRGTVMSLKHIHLIATAALLAACSTNPVTGRREITLVSEAQEIQMGQETAKQVEESIGLVKDEQLQAYVRRIGATLAAKSERPEIPWRF